MNLLNETVFKPKYIIHHGDSIFSIDKYPKTTPFNEFRRNIFFQRTKSFFPDITNHELTKQYTNTKNHPYVKKLNGELHDYFYENGYTSLHVILENFKVVEFVSIPKCAKVKIKYANFIKYNGNEKELVCESEDHYYFVCWGGS